MGLFFNKKFLRYQYIFIELYHVIIIAKHDDGFIVTWNGWNVFLNHR